MSARHLATERVLTEVLDERARQEDKWGRQDIDPTRYLAILAEEFGEVAKDVVEHTAYSNVQDHDGAAKHLAQMRTELVQTAAVAVAFVERLDRMKDGDS